MKICFIVDSIEKFDSHRVILDTIVSLGDGGNHIFSLYMNESSIIIPIALCPIKSTFLSKLYKKSYSLFKNPIFSEQVAKRSKLPEADFYICLSSGFSHYVKIPEGKDCFYYFLDLPLHLRDEQSRSLAMFRRYKNFVKELKYKSFASNKLAQSHEINDGYELIAPAFASRDFPATEKKVDNKRIIINLDDSKNLNLDELLPKFKDYDFTILTSKREKRKIQSTYPDLRVLTSVSNHELFIELQNTLLFVEFSKSFSEKVFASLASGVSCMMNSENFAEEFFSNDESMVHKFNVLGFENSLNLALDKVKSSNPELLRRFALRFNERVFKSRVLKIVNSLMKA